MNELDRLRSTDVDRASRRAVERFAARAVKGGLVDVGFGFADSPFGRLLVAATPRGLVRLAYPDAEPDAVLEELAAGLSPRVLAAPAMVDAVRRQLDEYFARRRRRFAVRLDLGLTHGFTRQVLRATARIPFGTVATYADVARGAGSARAVRAAGNALGANPIPIVVPCHRVVRTGGALGGYTGGLERKEFLLRLEGFL